MEEVKFAVIDVSKGVTVKQLAERYEVSVESMRKKLKEAGVVPLRPMLKGEGANGSDVPALFAPDALESTGTTGCFGSETADLSMPQQRLIVERAIDHAAKAPNSKELMAMSIRMVQAMQEHLALLESKSEELEVALNEHLAWATLEKLNEEQGWGMTAPELSAWSRKLGREPGVARRKIESIEHIHGVWSYNRADLRAFVPDMFS